MTMVCANCGVYCREQRSDGFNHYTVCAYCGRPELKFVDGSLVPKPFPAVPGTDPHPADALEAELLATFPDAVLVADDGPPWSTISEGRFGALQIRDVPLNNGPTSTDGRSVTGDS